MADEAADDAAPDDAVPPVRDTDLVATELHDADEVIESIAPESDPVATARRRHGAAGAVLAAGLFLARQVLAPVQTALGVRMQRRIDGALRDRALRIALRSTSIAPI
jgi:hypothetical protein